MGTEAYCPDYDCRPNPVRDLNVDPPFYGDCTPDEDLDPIALLQREILRKLKEDQVMVDLNRKLDKGVYRMKKDQLFTRMQVEKNEKEFQDCLCRMEQEKKRRQEQICQEEKFAYALRELKDEEVRKSAFEKQLLSCAPEIRELEAQLRRAYCGKTLYAQRIENEALRLEEKRQGEESYQQLLEKMAKEDVEAEEKRKRDFAKKKEYFKALTNQLGDATSKKAQAEEQYAKDKGMVDEIIRTIEHEEMQDLLNKSERVRMYRKEIDQFLQARDHHRERERGRIREEEANIQKYTVNKEVQVAQYRKAKEEQEKAREGIVAKAIERIMKEQYRQEEMEELRRELYEEELAAEVRRKELEELERKMKQMKELRAAAEEAKRLRAEKLAADKKEEEEYRAQLMNKFSEDEKLEQMAYQKRRQREREHRKIVEQMIIDRRCLHAQEREREQTVLDCFDEETKRRELVIADERIKLLKKHGPKLLGFLPRGTLKNWAEVEALGPQFVEYYRNQPTAPDPTTIDSEPCEEEIFRTMELPKYAKY